MRWLLITGLLLFSWHGYAQLINRAEYFIDNDPGQGNGTSLTVPTPGASVSFNASIPTTSLSTGFHTLGIRTRSSVTGRWSIPAVSSFYIVPPVSSSTATSLRRMEYFFDTDPGNGNGTAVTISVGATVNQSLIIPISSLPSGFHTVNVRVKDNLGRWSISHSQSFYIVPATVSSTSSPLTEAEYFFNTDPGQGNGISLSISPATNQSNTFAIPLTGLPQGFHRLNIRYRDNRNPNRWSHASQQVFYIANLAALQNITITRVEYYIDTDPGYNQGTPLSIAPAATIDQTVAIDLSNVATGNHLLFVRAKDSNGFWSDVVQSPFTISNCTPPSQPTVADQTRCGEGTITFTASGATGTQEYRWYDDAIAGSILTTGATFTTTTLSQNKLFYATIYDPNTTCESARKTINATIVNVPKPAINPTGTISFCEGGSVFLSAPVGFSTYNWSNGQTTQQILVSTAGNYTVQVGNGTCLSEASDPVTIATVAAPAKPVISVNGNTTICGTGSVELSAPTGFQYTWSTGATTQSIIIAQTGVYFVTVRDATNCSSLPSDPVAVSIQSPPCGVTSNEPPAINNAPLAAPIEGKVQLDLTSIVSDKDNNLDFSTLSLVNSRTSRGAAAIIDASYNLLIDYSGMPFTGIDRITIEVCDLAGECTQQVIDIEVVGQVIVYNGVTPDGDGKNDILLIKYIDVVEGADQNTVTIRNRWGDKVFDIDNYNNTDRYFNGVTNNGQELPSGTYFYTIEFGSGLKPMSGFLTLLR
jgi:gliding motility-associated-like protein